MADIKVIITEQVNPSVTISEQQSNSVTVNTIPRATLSSEISSNDAEIASLIAATGALSTATGTLTGATGELSAATGNLNNDLNNLSGTLTGVTGQLIPSGGDADINDLTVTGNSTLSKTLKIFPPQGRAIYARATNSNNAAIQVVFEGPTTVGHDLFKKAGFTNGFGDGSNHFHDLTDINRIKQAPEGDVKNLERVQERYYAITDNNLPNGNAAFWAWHRTARKISTSNVDTSNATLNVTGLQGSSNRLSDSQKPFRFNTSPVGKSEEIEITLNSHSFSVGDSVKMIFSQAFEGPIVAAGLFGKVASASTNTFGVELYGGNYKTTSEVALGTSQTALDFEFVTLQTVGTDTIVQNGNEVNLQHYSKTNFTPNRLRDNTLKASWSSAHGLKKNETLMIITAADRSTLEVKQGGYVIDPDPDGDGLSAIIVYGRRIDTIDLSSFTAFGASNWSIHKGSIDGIHDDTLGDNLFNFNANNVGEYKQYQIGPGCETDADCISIGKNVYNKDASTIKIGYDNAMLDVRSDGIKVDGNILLNGTVDGRDVATDGTKLNGIEDGATADQTAAEIRSLVDSATDSNVFTDTDHSKLDDIEDDATADQTDTEIKTAYENNTNTNAFTDTDRSKLDGVADGADVTPSWVPSSDPAYATSAQGTKADDALAASAVSTFGGELIDDADAATARTTLGLGSVENKSSATIREEIVDSDIPSTVARLASPTFEGALTTSSLKFGAGGKQLKEYDYGTFTPTFVLDGGANGSQSTYAKQEGYYVKIGRQVTINIMIKITNFDSAFKTASANSEIGISGLPHSAKIEGSDGPDVMIVRAHPRKGWQNLGDNSYNGSVGSNENGVIYFEKNVGQGEFGPAPGAGVGWNYERIKINDFHLHPFNFTADGTKAFTFQICGSYITDDDV